MHRVLCVSRFNKGAVSVADIEELPNLFYDAYWDVFCEETRDCLLVASDMLDEVERGTNRVEPDIDLAEFGEDAPQIACVLERLAVMLRRAPKLRLQEK
jgi:hypothetical protein